MFIVFLRCYIVEELPEVSVIYINPSLIFNIFALCTFGNTINVIGSTDPVRLNPSYSTVPFFVLMLVPSNARIEYFLLVLDTRGWFPLK